MRSKAFFFLKDKNSNKTARKTFGFKFSHPTQSTEMKYFEKHLLGMIKWLKFRNVQVDFQTKIKHNILKIRSSRKVFMFLYKTKKNLYQIPPNDYKWLLHENITKTHKKSTKHLKNAISLKAKHISKHI